MSIIENPMVSAQEPRAPRVVAKCGGCKDPLLEGEEVWEYEDNFYCDVWCLVLGVGAKKTCLDMEYGQPLQTEVRGR